MPGCRDSCLSQYETNKLVRIQSVRFGSLKWILKVAVLVVICVMMVLKKEYQEFDPVVSSVTTKNKNSFFVVTNVIVTKNQKQGKCPEVLRNETTCTANEDCEKGASDKHSHGINTGLCVKFDVLKKTCEVSAWCPIETETRAPRPALLAAAENFTVMVKNNIRFPAFNFIRRNILPQMNHAYLRSCQRENDSLCPIFRLGDMVREAGEKFSDLAVEVRTTHELMCLTALLNGLAEGVVFCSRKLDDFEKL
ncbi:unnamed protein product [Pleuronectes platessa]|uniref:Purinergic receptor n=1 Tax=Pleuronectes platessa TaxID=8262 RepID=A0A9N7Y7H7_PLEPL|nr:unnamed protein product [Pleuronectes platessa]